MDETTIVDTEKVSVSKLDTGIGSIWVADYVNRSKTYLPKLLDAGSPEYKERASENARLLDKYVISELSLALNKGLTVSGPATETTAMQSYQDDIRCKTNIEKDRTGAVLFDVFSKNWELISREGPAFQLPLDEAMNDPVNPGLPATCFIDFTIDEMTYQDRPMMIAFKDLWIKKLGQFIPRRVFDNHRFLKIIAGRKRYIPPTEIPLDDPSFTDYTIDEKSFMDKPTLHKIKCDALKRRKCLLTRWSGEHLTKDKHAWHIDHFKQFVAAHEANVEKMQSLSPIEGEFALPKKATFYLQKFSRFSLLRILKSPAKSVTLNRESTPVKVRRWDVNKIDTVAAIALFHKRRPNLLDSIKEDHMRAFLQAHNSNVQHFQTLLDCRAEFTKCQKIDHATLRKQLQADQLTNSAVAFAGMATAALKDAFSLCYEQAFYGALYYPYAEVWEKPFLVTAESGNHQLRADQLFAEYSWEVLGTSCSSGSTEVVVRTLIDAFSQFVVKVNTRKNRSTDCVELRLNLSAGTAKLCCTRHDITVCVALALQYNLRQGSVSEVEDVRNDVLFQLCRRDSKGHCETLALDVATPTTRWIWSRQHSQPCAHVRFPYDTALGGLGNPWTLPGNQLDTARIKNNIELVSFSQSPPPPSLQPPEFTTDLRWHRRRHLLFAAAADKRTIDPVVLHKHIVALLNAAGEVVKAPLPLPFRVWRSERVLQSDPFEKAAYLIHFDKFEDFQRALSESPSLSTAESWLGESLLEVAAAEGKMDCATLLIEGGANVNHTNKALGTPLHAAARGGHVDIILLLLEVGASLSAFDKNGCNALYVACASRQAAAALLFIDRDAEVDTCDKKGVSLLDATILSSRRYYLDRSMWPVVGVLLGKQGISAHLIPSLCEELRTIPKISPLLQTVQYQLAFIPFGEDLNFNSILGNSTHSGHHLHIVCKGNLLHNFGTVLVCRAILRQQAQSRKIRLDLQACEVGDTGADAIAELLRADKLAALDISSNRLTETGVASVMNAISSDNALCQLSLRNLFPIADERKKKKKADKDVQQKVISDDTASVMASAIRRSRRLNTIHLCANHFTESGVQIIVEAVAVSSSLQTLDFSHCPHTWPPLALHHLCSALSVTPSPALLHLYLDKCNLGSDDAMRSLSEMLKVNTTLQSLSVCGNAISDAGVIHLAQALRVNTTLQNLQLINSFDTLRKGNPNYTVGEDGGAVAVAEAVAVNCRSALVSLSGVRLNLGACLKVLDLDATHRSSDNKVILQEIKKRRGLV